jgi:hypothetical protein
MKRVLLLAAALALPAAAHAQLQTSAVAPSLEVQRLAPQLVAFAGGDLNFANLVNGLALGLPVTLTTPLATGGLQAFTFTPTGAMTSTQIAQVLETARQSLIARGIATPTAQQLGTTLAGGALATSTGTTAVNGLVNSANAQSPATAIQNANSAATNAAAGSTGVRNTSDSPLPRGVSDTPPLPVPGVTTGTQATPVAPTLAPATPAAPSIAPATPSGLRQMR